MDETSMETSMETRDRISELPSFIIHQIMSNLSTKEVAQTSILSKTWNRLQASYPILDFDHSYFGQSIDEISPYFSFIEFNNRFRRRSRKFMKFVDVSLLRFCQLDSCIQKFRLVLVLPDVNKSASLVDKWISLSVKNAVKELDLKVVTDNRDGLYTWPQTIFSAKQVTLLRLISGKLKEPSGTIRLDSLKSLTLERVFINERMVQKLASECTLLEDLYFSRCEGLEHLCVSGAPKLKSMTIEHTDVESIQIAIASLQKFTKNWYYGDRPIPIYIDLDGCPHLKMLKLDFGHFADEEFHQLISGLPLLEHLVLHICTLLKRIIISSNQLKYIYLGWCDLLEGITISCDQLKTLELRCLKNLKALDVDTPNLHSFIYNNDQIPCCSINAPCSLEVSISEYLKFNYSFHRSLPCHVGKLHLVRPSNYRILLDSQILLDSLFCICYPNTLSVEVLSRHDNNKFFFQWLYNELTNRDFNCCNSQPVKCWRHYLKDVEIEGFFKVDGSKLFDKERLLKLFDSRPTGWPLLIEGVMQFHLDWC